MPNVQYTAVKRSYVSYDCVCTLVLFCEYFRLSVIWFCPLDSKLLQVGSLYYSFST